MSKITFVSFILLGHKKIEHHFFVGSIKKLYPTSAPYPFIDPFHIHRWINFHLTVFPLFQKSTVQSLTASLQESIVLTWILPRYERVLNACQVRCV